MSCVQPGVSLELAASPVQLEEEATSSDVSLQSAMLYPGVLCAVMLLLGLTASQAAGLRISGLFLPYLFVGVVFTFAAVGVFAFIEVAKLARISADRPLTILTNKVRSRSWLLLLPALAFPLFLAGFTAAKTSIPYLVGYSWDAFLADLDVAIFGDDAWRIAQKAAGTNAFWLWQWIYTTGWGLALLVSSSVFALYADNRRVGIFFTAMFATWIVGGCLMAYAFSSAGPVFAGTFDPSLHVRFDPIRSIVASNDGPVNYTQTYLMGAVYSHVAVKGGGISAMPSMHLGGAAIYVLAALGTRWLLPTILFWLMIFFASGYFGYHYWVDGIVGALVACLCWVTATKLYDAKSTSDVAVKS